MKAAEQLPKRRGLFSKVNRSDDDPRPPSPPPTVARERGRCRHSTGDTELTRTIAAGCTVLRVSTALHRSFPRPSRAARLGRR